LCFIKEVIGNIEGCVFWHVSLLSSSWYMIGNY
jgi:hypothetical protein